MKKEYNFHLTLDEKRNQKKANDISMEEIRHAMLEQQLAKKGIRLVDVEGTYMREILELQTIDDVQRLVELIAYNLGRTNELTAHDSKPSRARHFRVVAVNQGKKEETLNVTAIDKADAKSQVVDSLDVPAKNIKSIEEK